MKFYVYLWLRDDGSPYYVGKGVGRRGFTSVRHSVHRPVLRDKIIVQEYESESEAFHAERFFIEFFGRIDLGTGCLRNKAEGGLGGSAAQNGKYVRTETHRKQIRERMRGNSCGVGGQAGQWLKAMPEDYRRRKAQAAARARWGGSPNVKA